jgi:hypothetical protein
MQALVARGLDPPTLSLALESSVTGTDFAIYNSDNVVGTSIGTSLDVMTPQETEAITGVGVATDNNHYHIRNNGQDYTVTLEKSDGSILYSSFPKSSGLFATVYRLAFVDVHNFIVIAIPAVRNLSVLIQTIKVGTEKTFYTEVETICELFLAVNIFATDTVNLQFNERKTFMFLQYGQSFEQTGLVVSLKPGTAFKHQMMNDTYHWNTRDTFSNVAMNANQYAQFLDIDDDKTYLMVRYFGTIHTRDAEHYNRTVFSLFKLDQNIDDPQLLLRFSPENLTGHITRNERWMLRNYTFRLPRTILLLVRFVPYLRRLVNSDVIPRIQNHLLHLVWDGQVCGTKYRKANTTYGNLGTHPNFLPFFIKKT